MKVSAACDQELMDKQKILVVDDDEAVRSVTFEMLKRLGFEVTTADSGATALEEASHQSFDLVLLDLAMPNMSGVEVFSSLKALKPESRVIFMTGYSKDEFSDLLSDNEDTTSVLSKPFPMQELKVSVENMLAR
jgi:two-component system cell cycle sensor histidine kinase/response regulator CckA